MVRNKKEKLRYSSVGFSATSIDFIILFLLSSFGVFAVLANFISTGIAFCFSFFANRQFTFKDTSSSRKRQLPLFFVFTFIGIWGIQPFIIWSVTAALSGSSQQGWVVLFVAKTIATFTTLLWNYYFYTRVVFKHRTIV